MSVHIITNSEVSPMYINDNVINQMQDTLKIAADATRLKILSCLLDELGNNSHHHCSLEHENGDADLLEKCVNDIALQIGASQSLVSHQLKVLKDGDFVKSRKEGTKIYYSLKDEHVREIIQITYEHVLERFNEND